MTALSRVIILKEDDRPAFAVLPYADYQRLLAAAEDAADADAVRAAETRLAAGEEVLPFAITERLLDGENPLRVWRSHRGLTQAALAGRAGMSQHHVSLIEAGKRRGSAATLRRLADALGVDLDDIVAP